MKIRSLLASFILILVIILVVKTGIRISFPWDLLVWTEHCFMMHMLKIFHGLPVFTSVADANSHVYSPGLEYLTYFILHPLGLELDVRFCRLVNVFIGVLAAVSATYAAFIFIKAYKINFDKIIEYFITFGLALLLVFHNYTSEVPHPDNLHILHAILVFILVALAIGHKKYYLAIFSVCLAGVGVLIKQSNAPIFLAPVLIYLILGLWNWYKTIILGLISCLFFGISLLTVWSSYPAFQFTFLIPRNYPTHFPQWAVWPPELTFSIILAVITIFV
ncbi:MAG: hypothetical protein KKE11_00180, partial [Gammaproteobacteria bacterium]|nr:hypothetical protein [Gammaproteobacteria bacterium]